MKTKFQLFSAPLLLASTLVHATGLPAEQQVTVTGSDGKRYVISATSNSSFTSIASTLQSQPWWGNQTLAGSLANQTQDRLGSYNSAYQGGAGILFAYAENNASSTRLCYLNGSVSCSVSASNFSSFRWAIGHLALDVTKSSQLQGNIPALGAATVIDAHSNLQDLFSGLTTDQQVSNAVSQILPLLNGGGTAAVRASMTSVNNLIQARIDRINGRSSGDDFVGDRFLWMKPFASRADQDDRDGQAGYKAETYGLAFGADRELSPGLRFGGAFAYAGSSVHGRSADAPQGSDIKLYQLIGYGSYALDARSEIDFQLDVGLNHNQGHRQISFTSTEANSNYDSQTAHAGVSIGRSYALGGETSLTPSVRADYTWIKDKAYRESGAGLLDLTVDGRTTEALVLGIDNRLALWINDRTTLAANLGVGYDTMNKRAAITSAFAGAAGAAFVTYGVKPSPWLGRGGIGAEYKTLGGLEVTGRYDVEYRESFLNQTTSANVRWAF